MINNDVQNIISQVKYPKRLLAGLDDIDLSSLHEYVSGDKVYALGLRMTNKCNYQCIYCGTSERRGFDGENTLTTEEYKHIIDQASKIGVRTVIFGANGEPLLTKNMIEVVEQVSKHNMVPIIFTNASIIGNDDLCFKYHGFSGIDFVKHLDQADASLIISCESIQKEKYNNIVGQEGAHIFNNAIERIKAYTSMTEKRDYQGIPLCRIAISSVIMPCNYDDRYELVEFSHSLNGLIIMKIPSLHGSAKENADRMFSVEAANKIKSELEMLSDKQATLQILNLACVSWTLGISINNQGQYMTCMTEESNPYESSSNARNTKLLDLIGRRKELLKLKSTICPVKDKYYVNV